MFVTHGSIWRDRCFATLARSAGLLFLACGSLSGPAVRREWFASTFCCSLFLARSLGMRFIPS